MNLSPTELGILAVSAIGFGLYLLVKGGNATIDGASSLAKHWGISASVIGFTIVGFGTSLPELMVSINANFKGSPGLALGNVVGSNIANILLIAGFTAFLAAVTVRREDIKADLVMMSVATAILTLQVLSGSIPRWQGGLMLALLVIYVIWALKRSRDLTRDAGESLSTIENIHEYSIKTAIFALIMGLCGVALGAEVLVRGAVVSAGLIGVPESVVGLTIVAFGTSVPELSVSMIAAKKGQSEIVIGNVVGSNVFNILSILGIAALIKPFSFPDTSMMFDLWVVGGVSIGFSLWIYIRKGMSRPFGALMLLGYCAYIGVQYL